jgi:biopolymer transport protein TolQ
MNDKGMNQAQIQSQGILHLLLQAGPVGKLVLLLLLIISVFCWAIIFSKSKALKAILNDNKLFLDFFWQSKSMDEIFNKTDQYAKSPIASVFKSGMREIKKLPSQQPLVDLDLETIERALQKASNEELSEIERNTSWLATTASAAPFIGLFGTVWGIMSAFQNIGQSGTANLAVVAPGISEALITTAMGIGAAIPAAIAYNHFVGKIKRVALDIDSFNQDFLNTIKRSQWIAKHKGV